MKSAVQVSSGSSSPPHRGATSSPQLGPSLSPSLKALQERLCGTCIGSYRISRLIGYGGMGAVFEALHRTLELRAAVKVLTFTGAPDDKAADAVKRFLDEAKALSTVHHAGLVRLFDSGQLADGTIYMLMEYLSGESLSARLGRCGGRLPLERALHLVRQIASALCEVHGKSIVHRDLTPSNLFLIKDDAAEGGERVKLLDFGIAKIRSRRERHTKTGECFGTPRYMSPEQCEGSAFVDDRADIYTLGVLLFELLTGGSPYVVESGEAMPWMFAHVSRRPRRLEELAPAVPAEIARLVAEMLDKVPAQRPSAAQVVMRLRRHARQHSRSGAVEGSAELVLAAQLQSVRLTMSSLLTRQRFLPTLTLLSAAFCGVGFLGWSQFANSRETSYLAAAAAPGMVQLPGQQRVLGSSDAEVAAALVDCEKQRAPSAAPCRRDQFAREQPTRNVTVSTFQLDQQEVTNREYAEWLNQVPLPLKVVPDAHDQARQLVRLGSPERLLLDFYFVDGTGSGITQKGGRFVAREGFAERPVVQVTWHGAREYCQGHGRDLPSEAQWEFAARGAAAAPGVGSRYPWGDAAPQCAGVWTAPVGCSGEGGSALTLPQPVGTARQDQTPSGIYDLGGNVSEWVLDRFVAPYPSCGACIDPQVAPSTAAEEPGYRVIRGGSFTLTALEARSATRSRWAADVPSLSIGFRCASAATGATTAEPTGQ